MGYFFERDVYESKKGEVSALGEPLARLFFNGNELPVTVEF